jgi:hypothetical protein
MLLSMALGAQAQDKSRFVQDRFAIGFWVDPPADQVTDARYKEIAQANFTFVLGPFGPKNLKDVQKQLRLCEKYGLAAIVRSDFTKPEDLPESPACWGYHLVDEPNTAAFAGLKERVDVVRKNRPGKLAYINLLPNYANAGQLGAPTYDDYVERFCKEVGTDVLCMDYYPMMTPTADGREGYCTNLESMRKYSLIYRIPFWNFFNTMPFGPHHDPTESQIRWQIYTSLAYGAKGVLYFCYWSPEAPGGEFPKGGAIINGVGQRTRHYDQAKRINAVLKNLGPTLMKLTSAKVIRIKPTDEPAELLKGTPIKSLTKGGDYLIGVFKHRDDRQAVLINNYDPNYTIWPTVEFSVADKDVIELDGADGKEKPARDDSPIGTPGLQISLDAGEGRLFLLP